MKLIITISIMMLCIFPAASYTEDEIYAYADGVLAGYPPEKFVWDNNTAAVFGAAGEVELSNIDYAISVTRELAADANTIAEHFPGAFQHAAGFLWHKNKTLVRIIIDYP